MTKDPDFGTRLIAFLPNMRRFAISLTRSRDIADDLVQAACERALAHKADFDPQTRFDAWIFRIMRNLWIDYNRRAKTAGPREDLDDHRELVGTDGESVAISRIALKDVSNAILNLPMDQREVLLLVCVEGLSYRDCADTLGLPMGTVMSRLARARINLAQATGISGDAARSSATGVEK